MEAMAKIRFGDDIVASATVLRYPADLGFELLVPKSAMLPDGFAWYARACCKWDMRRRGWRRLLQEK